MALKELFAFSSLEGQPRTICKETHPVQSILLTLQLPEGKRTVCIEAWGHHNSHYCQPSQNMALRSILFPKLSHNTTPNKVPTPLPLYPLSPHLLLPPSRQRHPLLHTFRPPILPNRNKKTKQ